MQRNNVRFLHGTGSTEECLISTRKCHTKFLTSDMHSAEAVILKLHVKLTPGWVLIQVNFDPLLEIGHKVERGYSFTRLQLEGRAKVLNI